MPSLLKRSMTALAAAVCMASAHAGYHVTAFGDTPGFDQIMEEDYASARALLDSPAYHDNDGYARHANLCISQLMSNQVESALTHCNRALSVAPTDLTSSVVPMFHKRAAVMTHLYSNRGVVRAVAGDLYGARADFERALKLDGDNVNARRNLEYVSGRELASRAN